MLPWFSSYVNRELHVSTIFAYNNLLILFALVLFTVLATGLYPAVILSNFKPAAILRPLVKGRMSRNFLRRILVVFQFSISLILIICVEVIFKQVSYMHNADLGFDRENIILLSANDTIQRQWNDIKSSMLSSPYILSATLSKRVPSGRLMDAPGFNIDLNGKIIDNPFNMPHNRIEHDFFKTYKIKIVAGRDFSIDYPQDETEAYILNETAVRQLGLKMPTDVIGAPMQVAGGLPGHVIGVVQDFNYESMHYEIQPMVSYIRISEANTMSLRIAPGNPGNAIDHIGNVWKQYQPDTPLEYNFLNERLDALYRNEQRMMQMFGYLSVLTIFIACLGLIGLASFSAEQRTKEIGIRKVLGASTYNMVFLLSKEFTKWIVAANIVAWPIAWYFMHEWLQNFAYRIRIDWWLFLLAGAVALGIALLTVSWHAFKTAWTNPVKALRYE
jgi:putative ABC transport system permease protein